jgi:hypothetical protein
LYRTEIFDARREPRLTFDYRADVAFVQCAQQLPGDRQSKTPGSFLPGVF